MNHLVLMRHGHAVDGPDDDIRPLSDVGRRQAAATAEHIRLQVSGPFDVVCSGLVRARQTAEIVSRTIRSAQPGVDRAYVSESDPALAALAIDAFFTLSSSWDIQPTLVIVSHQPLLPRLARLLIDVDVAFGTATALHLVRDNFADRWQHKALYLPTP